MSQNAAPLTLADLTNVAEERQESAPERMGYTYPVSNSLNEAYRSRTPIYLQTYNSLVLLKSFRDIKIGEQFIAGRNTGPWLLTAEAFLNYTVISKEQKYPYDFHECYGFEFVDSE